jgi:hypothetical protein
MIWPTHSRFRNKLSAYMDGELSPREDAALEAHLASCRSCARELEGLRLASAALREMPEATAPRSFALTPQQAARPARALRTGPSPALMMGPRLAAGALAVALAVVVFMDVGNVTDTQNTRETNSLTAAPAKLAQADARQSADDQAYSGDYDRAAASPEATSCGNCSYGLAGSGAASGGSAAGGPIGTGVSGVSSAGGGVAPAPTPEPGGAPVAGAPSVPEEQVPPVATGVPAPEPSFVEDAAAVLAPTPTPAAEMALNMAPADDATKDVDVPPSASGAMENDSGTDTLLLAEIGLAVALALAVFASVAVTYAGRRRMR